MKLKQILGSAFVTMILLATTLSILGVWGVVSGDHVWQMIVTLCILALGLGAATRIIDQFFDEKE